MEISLLRLKYISPRKLYLNKYISYKVLYSLKITYVLKQGSANCKHVFILNGLLNKIMQPATVLKMSAD